MLVVLLLEKTQKCIVTTGDSISDEFKGIKTRKLRWLMKRPLTLLIRLLITETSL